MESNPGSASSTQVMKLFLLRSPILTEKEIGMSRRRQGDRVDGVDGVDGDLEVDSVEADGGGPSKAEQQVADRLGEMGDDIQKKYEKGEIDLKAFERVIKSVINKQAYNTFSNGLTELCRGYSAADPSMNSLALSLFVIQKIAEAAKNTGANLEATKKYVVYGDMYIRKTFGEWLTPGATIPSSPEGQGTEIN